MPPEKLPAIPKRKRGHVGIAPKWSAGRWKWHARRKVNGIAFVGALRLTQEEAFEDYLALKKRHESLPKEIKSLSEALLIVIANARNRGLPEATITKQYEAHGEYLCDCFGGDTLLTKITPKLVERFVSNAQKGLRPDGSPSMIPEANGRPARPRGPRSASTLTGRDLPLLSEAFRVARIESPVGQITNRPRKSRRQAPDVFSMQEVAAIIRRMRAEKFCDRNGKLLDLPAREYHADLVELLAWTGIRAGELCRIRVEDVDFRRKRIAITPKDRSNPREAVVTNELLPAIQRLVERARNASEECLVQGDGMAFLSNMFAKWQERLDEPRLNGRRLRQSAITGVLMEGASLLEAAQFAGHVKVSTTDLYVQTATNRQANVAASLSKHLAPEESNGEDASGPGRSPRGSSR